MSQFRRANPAQALDDHARREEDNVKRAALLKKIFANIADADRKELLEDLMFAVALRTGAWKVSANKFEEMLIAILGGTPVQPKFDILAAAKACI